MSVPSSFSASIEHLYAAAVDSSLWSAFFDLLCKQIGANSGMLIALDSHMCPLVITTQGVDPQTFAVYESHYMSQDLILKRSRAVGAGKPYWLGRREELISDAELVRSEFYNEFMAPLDQFHQAGLTIGGADVISFSGITLLRARRERDFEENRLEDVRSLVPHLRQSFVLAHTLKQLGYRSAALRACSESSGAATIIVRGDGSVEHLSSAAAALVAEGDGIAYRKGKIRAASLQEEQQLLKLVSNCARELREASGGAVLIRRENRKPLHVSVLPLPYVERDGRGLALLFVVDQEQKQPSKAALSRKLFKLTASEARLVDLLLNGSTLNEAADTLRITRNSARFMSKSVFRKAGLRSQQELLSVLLRSPSI